MDNAWKSLLDKTGAEALASCNADTRSFAEWLNGMLEKSDIARNEVIHASRLNQTFAYQIMAGTRRASRDKLIQLAFGFGFGIDDTCELLERGGVNPLCVRSRRDVAIGWSLEHRLTVVECDDLLWAAGELTLLAADARDDI